MAKTLLLTKAELDPYFYGNERGPFYKEAVAMAKRLRVHADGEYPKDIIEERRPHEDPDVKAYREKVWKAKTKPTFNKVLNSLSKIRRSSDYQVGYPAADFPRIPEGERLADYCEQRFPFFGSVTNWAFSVLLRQYLIDPNAVMVVKPLEAPADTTAFVRPYATIYGSQHVIAFRDEDFCIIGDPLTASVNQLNGAIHYASFLVITTERIMRYTEGKGEQRRYNLVEDTLHGLGFLPAYQLKAVVKDDKEGAFLYESRIFSMAEELDEAAREYSDLQAARVMNIYPERWEIASAECAPCNGTGKALPATPEGTAKTCDTCHGSGKISAAGPYGKLLISRSSLDAGAALPIPPAGYVQKDVEVVRVQDEGVRQHLRDALEAINMGFLSDVPLSQSGIAKEVDRDETTNFVHSIAEDLVRIMDWLYRAVATWRYSVQYSADEIKTMLPKIPVPEHFDLFSTRYAEADIKNAKDNKLSPGLIVAMETSYAAKKFSAEPEVRDRLQLVSALDPHAGVSEEDKSMRLANGAISKTDYIVSSNIQQFVNRAIIEDETFPLKPYKEQREVLEAYAKAIVTEAAEARRAAMVPVQDDEEEEEETDEVEGGGTPENGEQTGQDGE